MRSHSQVTSPLSLQPLLGRLLALAVLLLVPTLRAQDPTRSTFLNASDFWMQSEDRRLVPHPADFTLVVGYCDPEWRVFWGFDHGTGVFLPLTTRPLALLPGQRVRLQGKISTAGFDVTRATVLGTMSLIPVHDATRSIMDSSVHNITEVGFDAYVDRQSLSDPSHILLNTIVDGHRVALRVLNLPAVSPPSLEGAFIHAQGLYVWTADSSGMLHHIDVYVTGFANIRVLHWLSSDPRFNAPLVKIDSLNSVSEGSWVHVAGRVQNAAPGTKVVIRDGTGQLEVDSAQTNYLTHGDEIEAVGMVRGRGPSLSLTDAFYRHAGTRAHTALSAEAQSIRLRLADDITNLSLTEAAKGYYVRLMAVVTWSSPNARFFFVQDASGGLKINLAPNAPAPPPAGRLVDVTGTTVAGRLAPGVQATDVRSLSDLNIPEPRRLTLDQALTGYDEYSYVEIEGYLRTIKPVSARLKVDFSTPAGNFTAFLPPDSNLSKALHSVVLVRGVCTRIADTHGRPGGLVLWVQSTEGISIESSFPADPASVPYRSISELNRFSGKTHTRWVRTQGIVTLQIPGRYLYLQEGNESLKVLDRTTKPLSPGSRVQLMGLQGQEGAHFVLREATILHTGPGTSPAPTSIEPAAMPSDALDGRLVRIQGTLVDVSPRLGHLVYVLQSSSSFVECHLPLPQHLSTEPQPSLGSLISATGVYRLQYDEYQRPAGFDVDLRSAADLSVLRAAPWWTPERALLVSVSMLVALLLGLLWAFALHRKVAAQTAVIRSQLEKESKLMAELERSSRLEALGMLAGGIAHDFNNLLTIIIGNLTLSRMEEGVDEKAGPFLDEANKGAQRARVLAQKLLTFARGGSPLRKPERLPEIVREAAESASEDATAARFIFDFDEELWSGLLDRGQMLQAIHNVTAYSLGSLPKGGTLSFRAWNASLAEGEIGSLKPGPYLHLVVEDSGPGLDPKDLRHLFDPYSAIDAGRHGLDLAVVRSIVKRHEGHIEVESAPGSGTRFHLWLPASKDAPTAASAAPCEPPPPARAPLKGRVLFMDDEEPIRKLAAATLSRLGCEFQLASNGAEAVQRFQEAKARGLPFDLVVLDLTVPGGIGGREAILHLQKIDPQVQAIVSSGYSSDPVISDYKLHGFTAFVPKPYSVDELEACLRRALNNRQHA